MLVGHVSDACVFNVAGDSDGFKRFREDLGPAFAIGMCRYFV